MAKKKNPEQEAPPVEEQESNAPEDQEETPPQEEQPQEQEDEEQEAEEEPSGGEEQEEDPQEEQPPEEQPGAPAQEPASDESARLRAQLLNAQGRLAAYDAGVAPAMVDDAVTLAMAEAAKTGEVTEATVASAMDAVLKRHPEWKADSGRKKTGGFKIGADRDNASSGKAAETTPKSMKRWNRFK